MDIIIRIFVIYCCVLAGLRILGKREFGQLSPHELVTLLIIPEIVSPALTGQDTSLTGALAGTATLLGLVFVTSLLSHRFHGVEKVVSGQPLVLVQNGELLCDSMNRSRISAEEVLAEMRKAGLDDLKQVKWAVLESDGKISIVPMPAATADAGAQASAETEMQT